MNTRTKAIIEQTKKEAPYKRSLETRRMSPLVVIFILFFTSWSGGGQFKVFSKLLINLFGRLKSFSLLRLFRISINGGRYCHQDVRAPFTLTFLVLKSCICTILQLSNKYGLIVILYPQFRQDSRYDLRTAKRSCYKFSETHEQPLSYCANLDNK